MGLLCLWQCLCFDWSWHWQNCNIVNIVMLTLAGDLLKTLRLWIFLRSWNVLRSLGDVKIFEIVKSVKIDKSEKLSILSKSVHIWKLQGLHIPDICHRRDRRRLWRKIVHVEKFSPWHVVKWKISPHDKCGETLSHGEISPHYKCGENLSSGKFLHMRKVEKICHVEKFLLMRDVEKINQVCFK